MTGEPFLSREEWERQVGREKRDAAFEAARLAREEEESKKAHERTDLTDEELAAVARHHQDVEQWSCSGCWHGRTCTTGRLIREVQRRRKADR